LVKQSLNAASTDQRLLVFSAPQKEAHQKTLTNLKTVFNDPDISGRFHFDTAGEEDGEWKEKVKNESKENGIFIIHSHTYGQEGEVVAELASDASAEEIKKALLLANKAFAEAEQRKVYSEHVATGKRTGINYENTMPPGEDRDGDGKIDEKKKRPK